MRTARGRRSAPVEDVGNGVLVGVASMPAIKPDWQARTASKGTDATGAAWSTVPPLDGASAAPITRRTPSSATLSAASRANTRHSTARPLASKRLSALSFSVA